LGGSFPLRVGCGHRPIVTRHAHTHWAPPRDRSIDRNHVAIDCRSRSIDRDIDRDGCRSIAIESSIASTSRRSRVVDRASSSRHIPARTHRETREVLHLAHGTVRASSSQSFVFKPLCDHLPCVTRDRSLSRAPHARIHSPGAFIRPRGFLDVRSHRRASRASTRVDDDADARRGRLRCFR